MKKTEVKKLGTMGASELMKDATEAKEKLWEARRDVMSGKLKNNHVLSEMRRDIARMLTIVQNKRIAEKAVTK